MLKYYAINQFMEEIDRLEKKRKNNYYSVRVDVFKYFDGVEDINLVVSNADIIQVVSANDQKVLLKTRLPISVRKEGKRGGFRLISIVDKSADSVTFLSVYPKTGRLGKTDMTEKEYLSVLREYLELASNDALLAINMDNGLAVSEEE